MTRAFVILIVATSSAFAQPALLRVSGVNPRYFVAVNDTHKAIPLVGFHFWDNAIDAADDDPPEAFPYDDYLDSMDVYENNFIRLWAGWHNSNKVVEWAGDFWFGQNPYSRPGPGNANDGKLKFDLDTFDDSFFERMRDLCEQANARGMYVAVQLFNGWVTNSPSHGLSAANPWDTHPYNPDNNINSVDGDTDNDDNGEETQRSPYGGGGGVTAVWNHQAAYTKRMIDELNDLDNIIWETSNEAEDMDGTGLHHKWSRLLVDTIHAYEARKPKQHPVWYTGDWNINNDSLFASPAECVAPGGNPLSIPWDDAPPDSGGRKVVILDTDHIWGMLNEDGVPSIWRNFCRGTAGYVLQDNDFGCWHVWACAQTSTWQPFKRALGVKKILGLEADLVYMEPSAIVSTSSYEIAGNETGRAGQVIVYQTSGTITVDLSGYDSVNVKWIDPDDLVSGTYVSAAGTKTAGGASRDFTAPNARYDVLYLYEDEPVVMHYPRRF